MSLIVNELQEINTLLLNLKKIDLKSYKKHLDQLINIREKSKLNIQNASLDEFIQASQNLYQSFLSENQIAQTLQAISIKGGLLSKLGQAVQARIAGRHSSFRFTDVQSIPLLDCLPPDSNR